MLTGSGSQNIALELITEHHKCMGFCNGSQSAPPVEAVMPCAFQLLLRPRLLPHSLHPLLPLPRSARQPAVRFTTQRRDKQRRPPNATHEWVWHLSHQFAATNRSPTPKSSWFYRIRRSRCKPVLPISGIESSSTFCPSFNLSLTKRAVSNLRPLLSSSSHVRRPTLYAVQA